MAGGAARGRGKERRVRGGRALKIGQPAVTEAVARLDECYGLPLMERVGGRLSSPPPAKKVYPLAAQTLDRQLALREDLQSLVGGRKTLRLEVASPSAASAAGTVAAFCRALPEIQGQQPPRLQPPVQTHIASGLADLALLESAPDHPDILVQKWMDDELWLVCGPTHALAGTELIPVEQLQKLNYVLRERRSAIRDALDEALRAIGVQQLDVAMEVGSTDAIVEILARGRHVSFLPRFAVAQDVAQGKLARVKVTGFRIMRMLWVARNRSKLDHPVAEAFIKLLRETTPAPGG